MRERLIRITTVDTKETYEFPEIHSKKKAIPQLWMIELKIYMVGENGQEQRGHYDSILTRPLRRLEKEEANE